MKIELYTQVIARKKKPKNGKKPSEGQPFEKKPKNGKKPSQNGQSSKRTGWPAPHVTNT